MPTPASIGWLPASDRDDVVIAMANPDGSTNRYSAVVPDPIASPPQWIPV